MLSIIVYSSPLWSPTGGGVSRNNPHTRVPSVPSHLRTHLVSMWKVLLLVALGGIQLGVQKKVPMSYLYSSSVSDPTRGFALSHSERRTVAGLVTGQYGYSDGFYRVSVEYTAGPHGFRVIRQSRIPIKPPISHVTVSKSH